MNKNVQLIFTVYVHINITAADEQNLCKSLIIMAAGGIKASGFHVGTITVRFRNGSKHVYKTKNTHLFNDFSI